MARVMEIIAKETNGKSYNTEKYSFDTIGVPSFDYDDTSVKLSAEGKRVFLNNYYRRMDSMITHKGKRKTWRKMVCFCK